MIAFTITDNSINIVLDGAVTTVSSDATNFNALKEELKKGPGCVDEARVATLANVKAFVEAQTFGRVKIGEDGRCYFDSTRVGGTLGERIRDMVKGGYDISILAKFMDKLGRNPIESAKADVYAWIEASGLTLTPEGNFLAFKRVNADYTSIHDSTTRNNLGMTVQMNPEDCDTNSDNTCSTGLHFCGFDYLRGFGGSRTIIVEVNPIDVVSIPTDYRRQKGRAWKYKVVDEVENNSEDDWLEDKVVHDTHPTEDENEVEVFPTDSAFGPCDNEFDEDEDEDDSGFGFSGGGFFQSSNGNVYTFEYILQEVSDNGQRAFSRKHSDVPRTTLQSWLAKIAERASSE